MNPNSILATLAEIEANPFRGLVERDEKREAMEIIERMEAQLGHRLAGDRRDHSQRRVFER